MAVCLFSDTIFSGICKRGGIRSSAYREQGIVMVVVMVGTGEKGVRNM